MGSGQKKKSEKDSTSQRSQSQSQSSDAGSEGQNQKNKNKDRERNQDKRYGNYQSFTAIDLLLYILPRLVWAVGALISALGLMKTFHYTRQNFDCYEQDHIGRTTAVYWEKDPVAYDNETINYIIKGCDYATWSQVLSVIMFGAQFSMTLAVVCVLNIRVACVTVIVNIIFIILIIFAIVFFNKAHNIYPAFYGLDGEYYYQNKHYSVQDKPAGATDKDLINPGTKYRAWLIIDLIFCIVLIIIGAVLFILGLESNITSLCQGTTRKRPVNERFV